MRIMGIDEAGRGPWAGPVVAAAVILLVVVAAAFVIGRAAAPNVTVLSRENCCGESFELVFVERADLRRIVAVTKIVELAQCVYLRVISQYSAQHRGSRARGTRDEYDFCLCSVIHGYFESGR